MCFSDNRSKPAAAKVSAHLGNEAERAGTITTFGDLDESVMRWRGEYARRRFIVEICRTLIAERNHRQRSGICLRIADAEDVVDLTSADECIDFGHLSPQLVAITFN